MTWNPDEYESGAEEVLNELASQEEQSEAEAAEMASSLTEAERRMEQAGLYLLFIKNDVFSAGSASPEILEVVNREFKRFAQLKAEELLGIREKKESVPKQVEVQLPFDQEQVIALNSLANKILKRAAVQEASVESKPVSLKPIEAAAPVVQAVSPSLKAMPVAPKLNPIVNKPAQAAAPIQTAQSKTTAKTVKAKPGRKAGRAGGGSGYAVPANRPLGMPTAEQLINTMNPPSVNISADNITGGAAGVQQGSNDLVQSLVQQLTGGNVVAQSGGDIESSDQEDINGRF